MRTSAEILDWILPKMEGMIKYPKMWADTAIGLEGEYLQMLALVLFIKEIHTDRIFDDWRRFVHNKVGYSGALTVAGWLQMNNKLDDDWRSLTELLKEFFKFMDYVPIV